MAMVKATVAQNGIPKSSQINIWSTITTRYIRNEAPTIRESRKNAESKIKVTPTPSDNGKVILCQAEHEAIDASRTPTFPLI